jgi:outer membrane lipoprotein SlyB
MNIQYATVVSVRSVQIEGTKTRVGAAAGTATGGVIGRSVGDSMGNNSISRTIGMVLGGVAGGVGGAAVEEGVTRTDGVEVTIKLEKNNEILAIVQQDGGERFQPGERVRLVGGGKATRVVRDPGES